MSSWHEHKQNLHSVITNYRNQLQKQSNNTTIIRSEARAKDHRKPHEHVNKVAAPVVLLTCHASVSLSFCVPHTHTQASLAQQGCPDPCCLRYLTRRLINIEMTSGKEVQRFTSGERQEGGGMEKGGWRSDSTGGEEGGKKEGKTVGEREGEIRKERMSRGADEGDK